MNISFLIATIYGSTTVRPSIRPGEEESRCGTRARVAMDGGWGGCGGGGGVSGSIPNEIRDISEQISHRSSAGRTMELRMINASINTSVHSDECE